MEFNTLKFTIDPEFSNKIPAMSEEAFNGLRNDIIRDGYVRDPLVVWKEENILIDGHNRWKIIQENISLLGDKYKIDYKSFPDRWAAIVWICSNQLHKHNLNEVQQELLIQEKYDAMLKTSGGQIGNVNAVKKRDGQIGQLVSEEQDVTQRKPNKRGMTRSIIADEYGITEKAVRTAVEVGRGVNKGEAVSPGFRNDILSGTVKATKADLASLRNMEPEEAKQAVSNIYEFGNTRGETKEMNRLIRESAEQLNEKDSDSEYTIDDLISELLNNANLFTGTLRNSVIRRKELIKSSADKKRIKDAIHKISTMTMEVAKSI